MDLIPMESGAGHEGERILSMSEASRKLAEIVTAPVERKFVDGEVRLVGKVDFDETRVRKITAWVPGRIDRMFVDYTGIPVRTNDHLVLLYSPELLTAQEELLEAKRLVASAAAEQSEFLRRSNRRALESARKKLRLWGLTAEQVNAIEKRGSAEDHVVIRAPIDGIVIEKATREGAYVQVGTRIYTIADLTHVWIRLDAYESNLPWIRYGQEASFTSEALPGETFRGWISFIDPVVDPRTRTVKVRVNVENPDGRLKPGMFVHATVLARIAANGKVMAPRLAGKWICPMHPEVVKDGPGACDRCGMPLVRPADLGYAPAASDTKPPLVVPVSAVLRTGRRAVVYVEVPDRDTPTYEGVEVPLGPRAGDHYLIPEGLREGQRVVVNGNFKIDSALQIQAKPSLMSLPAGKVSTPVAPPEPPSPMTSVPTTFLSRLDPVYTAYFDVQEALAGDNLPKARKAFDALRDRLPAVDAGDTPPAVQSAWSKLSDALLEAATRGGASKTMPRAREAFLALSAAALALEREIGHAGAKPHAEAFCPMAFNDQGGGWLQRDAKTISNPYFGAQMLRCGEIRKTHPGR
jgi:Cu(I)/Ag(I) efflux system membrane fusion protein